MGCLKTAEFKLTSSFWEFVVVLVKSSRPPVSSSSRSVLSFTDAFAFCTLCSQDDLVRTGGRVSETRGALAPVAMLAVTFVILLPDDLILAMVVVECVPNLAGTGWHNVTV